MIQKDSLNTVSLPEGFFLQKNSDSLFRFFSETGKVEIVETFHLENEPIPLWVHLSLFFWIFIVIFVRQSYMLRLRQIFAATLKPKHVKYLQREGNLLKQSFPALLLLLYAFVVSLFAFLAVNQYYPSSFYFSLGEGFLLLYGAVVLYHLLKFTAIKFLGTLFDTRAISTFYLLDHFLFHISEGLVLFPLVILFIYSELQLFLYIAIIVLIALWIYRLLRAISIGLGCINYSRSYLFLYLCTLEVLPVFLLYKLSLQFV